MKAKVHKVNLSKRGSVKITLADYDKGKEMTIKLSAKEALSLVMNILNVVRVIK